MTIIYDNIKNYQNKDYNKFLSILNKNDKIKLKKLIKTNDKKRLILSRYLLNKLIENKYNISYNKTKFYYNHNKKPLTNNFFFNISHKEDYVVAVISKQKIGIDIEKIKTTNLNIINYFCTPKEKEYILNSKNKYKSLFEIYCLKEAYIKMLGTNLSNIKNIEFQITNNKITCTNNPNIKSKLLYNIDNYIVAIIEDGNYIINL